MFEGKPCRVAIVVNSVGGRRNSMGFRIVLTSVLFSKKPATN